MKFKFDDTEINITRRKKRRLKIIFSTISLILLWFVFLIGLNTLNGEGISRGLKVADVTIGSLDLSEVQEMEQRMAANFLSGEIILNYQVDGQKQRWITSPQRIGVEINVDDTLTEAMSIGHSRNFVLNAGQEFLALFGYYNLSFHSRIDKSKLENFVANNLSVINQPAVNAGWRYDENQKEFVPVASQNGTIVDQVDLKKQLTNRVEKLSSRNIDLKLIKDYPQINEATEQSRRVAEKLLTKAPFKLIIHDSLKEEPIVITLTKEELADLIAFVPIDDPGKSDHKIAELTLGEEKLKNYLVYLSPLINRNPINAELSVVNNRATKFNFSEDGVELKIKENIDKVRNQVLLAETKADKEIELETSVVVPKITMADINNMGIVSFLGKGTSNFAGSPSNRFHNIRIGAAKFNGILIRPGEEFSFNEILGEVGPEQGYEPELVIKKNKTVPEYGGGLCQVSTTAFRAAVNTGLPITERYPHAFPVAYYNPQGFDATIYPPHPDLRFINNTPNYILMQTKIDGYYLTFEFYGTDDGRRVVVDGPYQYDIGKDGSMKARLMRQVYQDDELVEEKTFYSNYKSPALYPVDRNPLE